MHRYFSFLKRLIFKCFKYLKVADAFSISLDTLEGIFSSMLHLVGTMGFVCAIRHKRIVAKQLKHIQKTLIALNNIHPFSWENLEKENKARGRWDLYVLS